jgi:uncharacterized membrane protein
MDTTPVTEAPRTDSGASRRITLGILAAVIAVGLVFVLNTSEDITHWFAAFKWIHVSVAVFWVGGGLTLTALALWAETKEDPEEMATLARQAAFVGEKLFAPAGLIVLAMGITMVINSPEFSFSQAWVIIGLVGYALTFTTGVAFLAPRAKRISELLETKGAAAPETQAAIKQILLISRIDVGVLLIVVADMLMKPFS